MAEDEGDVDNQHFYDVDKFKEIIDAQASEPRPTGFGLFLARLSSSLDSMSGFASTFIGMMTVFAAPLIVLIGALYGLVGFLVSVVGVIGFLGFYVERKLGKSIRVDNSDMGRKLLAQVVGCALVLGVFYIIFIVILHLKLS